jgi:hypothetical protein
MLRHFPFLRRYYQGYVAGYDIPALAASLAEELAKINDISVVTHPLQIAWQSLSDAMKEASMPKEKEDEEDNVNPLSIEPGEEPRSKLVPLI